jgi:hypothetical protein
MQKSKKKSSDVDVDVDVSFSTSTSTSASTPSIPTPPEDTVTAPLLDKRKGLEEHRIIRNEHIQKVSKKRKLKTLTSGTSQ